MAVSKKFGLSSLLGEGRFFEIKANFFNVFNLLNLQPFNSTASLLKLNRPWISIPVRPDGSALPNQRFWILLLGL